MNEFPVDRAFGRRAFGADPGGYHAARSAYPEWVFGVLCERRALRHDTTTFEIGAGTGTATHRLLELGAAPLVAVEPDRRLAAYLRETISTAALTVICSSFEDVNIRDDREAILAELGRIAREEFQGRVIRNMTTRLYLAQRRL